MYPETANSFLLNIVALEQCLGPILHLCVVPPECTRVAALLSGRCGLLGFLLLGLCDSLSLGQVLVNVAVFGVLSWLIGIICFLYRLLLVALFKIKENVIKSLADTRLPVCFI
jgi:hypothetical protein